MFWLGKSKKGLSPVEVLLLAKLRARQIRNRLSDDDADVDVGQYGYEMIQDLNKLFSGAWTAKSGTIYPMLNRLEGDKGLIKSERKKSPLGPVKKIYNLTPDGKTAIDSLISKTIESNIDFMLNYIDLLTPFMANIEEEDGDLAQELFEKLMVIPTNFFNLALENAVTEFDQELKVKKLKQLKRNLEQVIRNIDKEVKDATYIEN